MSIRPRDRFLTLRRDNYTCQYCGRKPPEVALECDHVIAKAKGGKDELGNFITACRECNIGKRTTDVIDEGRDFAYLCSGCGVGISLGDDFEGWDSDTFCRSCIDAFHIEVPIHA